MAVNVALLKGFEVADEEANGELDVVGTASEIAGVGGFIDLDENNIGRKDKALLIKITTKKKVTYKVFGSKAVSSAFRNKLYEVEDLHGLRVIKTETNDGVATLKLVAWNGRTIRTAVKAISTVKASSETVTVESFEELAW